MRVSPLSKTGLGSSKPIVSILTPTFNQELFIGSCLQSAIAQTDPRWEQIVVDDGSDDGTEAIIRSIDDPRIRYIRRSHRGIMHLAESYNLALEVARGKFIGVLEGDDFWPPYKIERQLRLFHRTDIVLTWGRAGVANEVGALERTMPKATVVAQMQRRTTGETVRSLLNSNFIPAATVMCRRDALVGIGGFQQPDDMPTTDYPTWLELCRVGSFACSHEILGFHRKHPGQASIENLAKMRLVLDWGVRFVESLSESERAELGLSLDEAHRIERKRHAYLSYGAGRTALEGDQGPLARRLFRKAIRNGSETTRLKALFGLTCSYLGLDLERIATLASRVPGR